MKFLLSFLPARKLCALLVAVLQFTVDTLSAATWYVCTLRSRLTDAIELATLNRRTWQ